MQNYATQLVSFQAGLGLPPCIALQRGASLGARSVTRSGLRPALAWHRIF
jgi:hypothetical protein